MSTPSNEELCHLCRDGKLFAVEDWFKRGGQPELSPKPRRNWGMGIAIEKGFHSLVEVLLRNGVPADGTTLWEAVRQRRHAIVELLLERGADLKSVPVPSVVSAGDYDTIRLFLERGADMVRGYPFYEGFVRATRMWLGLYKQYRPDHPELQLQADMALRHFVKQGSLRGVSLLMWVGANPRNPAPDDPDESEDMWSSALGQAAIGGNLEIIKRLRPSAKHDDLNRLLRLSLYRADMELVRYWVSLGADINHVPEDGESAHRSVIWKIWSAFDRSIGWHDATDTRALEFAHEWFSQGAKWRLETRDERRMLRESLARLGPYQAYDLIKLFRTQGVTEVDTLANVLDTPKLKTHLAPRAAALAELLPPLQKWCHGRIRARPRQCGHNQEDVIEADPITTVPPPNPYELGHGVEIVRKPKDD